MTEDLPDLAYRLRQRFQIGQTFKTRGKHPRICTVTDVLRT